MTRSVSFALMLVIGCAANTGGGDDSDGIVLAGTWHYDAVTPVSNTCGSASETPSGDFAIDAVTSSGFQVLPNDGTPPFPCNLNGASFDCPNRAAGTADYPSAELTYQASANGTFSDGGHATGSQDATVACSGAACASVATFPCAFSVTFTIQAE